MPGFLPLLLLFFACSDRTDGPEFSRGFAPGVERAPATSAQQIFPHPENFAAGEVHGASVFPPGGLQPCLLCHDEGKASGPIPACTSCHDRSEVHEAGDFKNPGAHGPVAIQRGYRTVCARCHGADLRGGKSGISCVRTECHPAEAPFPHLAGNMRSPKTHGALMFRTGPAACLACHDQGSSESGKNSCFDCHTAAWVHTAKQYRDPEVHGPAAIGPAARERCAVCHSLTGKGKKPAPACSRSDCHTERSGFPHVSVSWNDPDRPSHGEFVLKNDAEGCTTCHSIRPTPGAKRKACWDCHTYPHPAADEFRDPAAHGKLSAALGRKMYEDCGRCHDLAGEGKKKRTSCSKKGCHVPSSGFPHVTATWSVPQSTQQGHGETVLKEGYSRCTKCHSIEPAKDEVTRSCWSCHPYPHKSDWGNPDQHRHGDFVVENEYNYDSCVKVCHTVESTPAGKTACKDCHEFPHPKEWRDFLTMTLDEMGERGFPDAHAALKVDSDTCAKPSCHAVHVRKVEENFDYLKRKSNVPDDDSSFPDTTCKGCHSDYEDWAR